MLHAAMLLVTVQCVGCGNSDDSAPVNGTGEAATKAAQEPARSGKQQFLAQLKAGREGRGDRIEVDQPLQTPEVLEQLSPEDTWLGELIVDEGVVRDAQIAPIAALPELWHLRLRQSPLSDAGLRQLADCGTLKILNLPQSAAGGSFRLDSGA